MNLVSHPHIPLFSLLSRLFRNDHGFRALVANVRDGYETTLRSGPLESLARTVHGQLCPRLCEHSLTLCVVLLRDVCGK